MILEIVDAVFGPAIPAANAVMCQCNFVGNYRYSRIMWNMRYTPIAGQNQFPVLNVRASDDVTVVLNTIVTPSSAAAGTVEGWYLGSGPGGSPWSCGIAGNPPMAAFAVNFIVTQPNAIARPSKIRLLAGSASPPSCTAGLRIMGFDCVNDLQIAYG